MADPTRPLPNLVPQPDGSWTGRTVLTPTALKTRGLFTLPPSKVVPVIVVPGIMGSNLRAATIRRSTANEVLKPGRAGLARAERYVRRDQDGAHMEEARCRRRGSRSWTAATSKSTTRGDISLPPEARNYGMTEDEVRDRDWGEVHWDSYGNLLYGLHVGLNHTFEMDPLGQCARRLPPLERRHGLRPGALGRAQHRQDHRDRAGKACRLLLSRVCLRLQLAGILRGFGEAAAQAHRGDDRVLDRACKRECRQGHPRDAFDGRAGGARLRETDSGPDPGRHPWRDASPRRAGLLSPDRLRHRKLESEQRRIDNKKAGCVADILGEQPEADDAGHGHLAGRRCNCCPTICIRSPGCTCAWSAGSTTRMCRAMSSICRSAIHTICTATCDPWYRLVDPELVDPAGKYSGRSPQVERAVRDARSTAPNAFTVRCWAPIIIRIPMRSMARIRRTCRSAPYAGWRAILAQRRRVHRSQPAPGSARRSAIGDDGRRARVQVEGKTALRFRAGAPGRGRRRHGAAAVRRRAAGQSTAAIRIARLRPPGCIQ